MMAHQHPGLCKSLGECLRHYCSNNQNPSGTYIKARFNKLGIGLYNGLQFGPATLADKFFGFINTR